MKGRSKNGYVPKGKGKRGKMAKPSKSFAKKVQAIVSKNAETKQAFGNLQNVAFNSGISGSADNYQVLPSINQGTADNSRIGDQIRAKSLTIKGAIVYNPSVGTYGTYYNARIACRLFIVMPKNLQDYASTNGAPGWQNWLLKKGGTTSGFTGALSDLWAPVNTDAITCYYDKIFYLNGTYQQTAAGSTQLLGSTKFFTKKFNLRNKLLRYDSSIGSGLTPTNWAPTLLLGYAFMDGSSPSSLTTSVTLSYDSVFDYEDC